MTAYEIIINQNFERGKADALDLRSRAADMDETGIIAEEQKVPIFEPDKDYSGWPVGAPVRELVNGEYQVFKWITPVNTAHYPGFLPSQNRAQCSLCHTTDPAKAKPFMPSYGISGLYMLGEVCTDPNMPDPTAVYRSLKDNNEFAPSAYPANWELVQSEVDENGDT